MKRKQSKGKERKRKERKDKKDNKDKKDDNKDIKDTDSKSKSTTQKKRRRYTHKKKKAKLMKKRSIRKQRGGNPTVKEKIEAFKKEGILEQLANKAIEAGINLRDAITKAKEENIPLNVSLNNMINEKNKKTLGAASGTDKLVGELSSIFGEQPLTYAAQSAALTKEARKAEADALGKARKTRKAAKARNTVTELKTEKPLTREETEQLLVNFNKDTTNTLRKGKYPKLQNIYNNIQIKNYDSIEKIDFVINELLKSNIFSGAMNKDSPDKNIKNIYSKNADKTIKINEVLPEKTRYRIKYDKTMREIDKIGYNLIKQKVNIINDLINKRNEINNELAEIEAAERAEARQAEAAKEAEDTKKAVAEEEAKRKAVEAAEEAAEGLRRLKVVQATREANEANLLNDETTYLLTSIKGKLEEINNDYTKYENYIQKYIEGKYGILNTLRKNYGTINGLHKSINERNTSILEINKNAPEDIKGTLVTATKTLTTATETLEKATTEANKLKEIIQVLQIINNNFVIINGNTPDTPKEKKLSKIAEQKYIVIPDPANNINKDYFCEGGIPAEAKNYQYYIIFLDGYVEGTEVTYNNKPIRLTKKQHNIENCLSKI